MGARYWRAYSAYPSDGYWCRHWASFEADLIAARQLLGPHASEWQLLSLVLDKDELDDLWTDVAEYPPDERDSIINRARLILTDEIPF